MRILSIKKYTRNKLAGFGWLSNDFEMYEILIDNNGETKAFNANKEMAKKGMFLNGAFSRKLSLGSGYTSWTFEEEFDYDSFIELLGIDSLTINDLNINERS